MASVWLKQPVFNSDLRHFLTLKSKKTNYNIIASFQEDGKSGILVTQFLKVFIFRP